MTIESSEFLLLANCCRWNFKPAPACTLEIPPRIDWSCFVMLARRHRVQGLVWYAMAQHADRLSDHARAALSSDARSIAASNLAIATECRALNDEFARAKLPHLFVKGLTVASLAYRSPLLKMGWDIDLLIDRRDLASSAGLLTERGYELRIPDELAQLQRWHGWSKESVWHRNGSFHVELHTRLADNSRLIPTIDVHSSQQIVEVIPSISLPTLAADELFAYLTVHGASSAWFRLKWISDLAAFIAGQSAEAIVHLYRRSQELGAGRAAGQALLLADHLFNTLQPVPQLRKQLESDRATRQLCRAALRMMTSSSREPTERVLGTLAIHWTQFLLQPGVGYQVSELRRQGANLIRQ